MAPTGPDLFLHRLAMRAFSGGCSALAASGGAYDFQSYGAPEDDLDAVFPMVDCRGLAAIAPSWWSGSISLVGLGSVVKELPVPENFPDFSVNFMSSLWLKAKCG